MLYVCTILEINCTDAFSVNHKASGLSTLKYQRFKLLDVDLNRLDCKCLVCIDVKIL